MGFEPMRLAPDELESSTLTTRSPSLAAYNKAVSVSRNALVAPRIELGLQEIYRILRILCTNHYTMQPCGATLCRTRKDDPTQDRTGAPGVKVLYPNLLDDKVLNGFFLRCEEPNTKCPLWESNPGPFLYKRNALPLCKEGL
jgi:hypothetical protein